MNNTTTAGAPAINKSALRRNSAALLLNRMKEAGAKKSDYSDKDKDFWSASIDSKGNGFAIIRFLPARNEDSLPYIKQYNQGFKVNDRWFINLCPTTIGLPSPCDELVNELWRTGLESDKVLARERKRKLRYISNILVIKDPSNPDNEGKVFKMGYGQKIFDKLMDVISPCNGEEARDPFSFFDGCVFKMKVKNSGGYRNYDDSVFIDDGDLYDGDEDRLTKLLETLHDIDAENSPEKFKSYAQLKKELSRILNGSGASEDSPITSRHENKKSPSVSTEYNQSKKPVTEVKTPHRPVMPVIDNSDEDDDLALFAALTSDD